MNNRIDVVSGASSRNSGNFSSSLRLLVEKDVGNGKLLLEQSISDQSDLFLSFEQRIAERYFTRVFWASQQQQRYYDINGAWGLELETQWELD